MAKRGRRTKLTEETQATIIRYVRAGSWDYIAAEAAGITARTFINWMRWGEKGNPRYIHFFLEVTKAKAEARVVAETKVFADKPDVWLRTGPGRSKEGRDGWTNQVEVHVTRNDLISELEEKLEQLAALRASRSDSDSGCGDSDGESDD